MFHGMSPQRRLTSVGQDRRRYVGQGGVAVVLGHLEHVGEVDVVPRQFIAQIGNDVDAQDRLSTHYEAREVPRDLGFFGAVQEQGPGGVIRVQDEGVVDAFV
jgi:hypothetical protein